MQTEQIEGVLDPPSHRARRDAEVLHRVGQLVLDDVAHEARRRVLAHHADQVGELTRREGASRPSSYPDLAGEPATGEVRHESVDRAEKGRLARTGGTDHQTELAFVDPEVASAEHGNGYVRIGEGDVRELDHRSAPLAASTTGRSAMGGTSTERAGLADLAVGATKAGSSATRMPRVARSGSAGTLRG